MILAIAITSFMLATIISLCVNQWEFQHQYTLEVIGSADHKAEPILYVLAVLGFLMMAAGFLLIYNVMSFSVSRDIRFYGQLRTIGMTSRQIKKMVFRQVLLLSVIGIPIGLLLSAAVSLQIVPLFLNMYSPYGTKGYHVSFHSLIFLGAAVFSFLTTMTGAFKPIREAACVSPIEAMRLSEYGYHHKKVHTSAFHPINIAWRNVFRVPVRTALVFCSLVLGMTVFMAVSVILRSADAELFTENAAANIKGDIYLRNNTVDSYGVQMGNERNILNEELLNHLQELPGLSGMSVSHFQGIKMDAKDEDGEIQNLPGYLYGIDADRLAALCEESGQTIDTDRFMNGDFVMVRDIWRGELAESEKVTFSIGEGQKALTYAAGVVLPAEFQDYFGTSYNWLPCIYMSEKKLEQLAGQPMVYDVTLDIERGSQDEAFQLVKELVSGESDILLSSGIEIRQNAEYITSTLTLIGNVVSAVLCLVGMMNLVNVISTSIFARSHELALMESVGQSKKQSRKELLCEGFLYAVIALTLTVLFGGVVTGGLYFTLKMQVDYMTFRFPWDSFLIMVFVTVSICLGIPELNYGIISKGTLVERLRKTE